MRSSWLGLLIAAMAPLLLPQPADSIAGVLRPGELGQTPYSAVKPPSWNGTLVLDLDFINWNPAQTQWFLDHGYALGGIARTQNESAYEIRDYIADLVNVRQRFIDRFGAPSRTIAFGVSRGGFPALGAMELHPDIFNGAVALSGGGRGVVGYLLQKLDAMWTLKTLVNRASTLLLVHVPHPPLPGRPNAQDPDFNALVDLARSTPQGRARLALAAAFDQAPTWSIVGSPKPAAGDFDVQINNLVASFNNVQSVRWQVEVMAGGNVSWNHDVDYVDSLARSGLSDLIRYQYRQAGLDLEADLKTLATAPRVSADRRAVDKAEVNIGYTGRIRGPVVLGHTTGDPADPPPADRAYEAALARAGTDALMRTVYSDRPGHATWSVLEKVTAFQLLIDRLDTGRWIGVEPGPLNERAERLRAESAAALGTSVFVALRPAAPLRTWDATNWGTYRSVP